MFGVFAVSLLASCGGDDTPVTPVVPDPVPTVLQLSTQVVNLAAIGATQTVGVTVLDQNGQAMAAQINWSSANPLVATVESTGLITARGNGAAIINVQVGNLNGAVGVTVEQVPAGIEISTTAFELDETTPSITLEASVVDAEGQYIEDAGDVTWASADTMIATVSADGVVEAVRRGDVGITASYEGIEETALATVLLPYRFTMVFNTELSAANRIVLQFPGEVDVVIHWGDGTTTSQDQPGVIGHTYSDEGRYLVELVGSATHIQYQTNRNDDGLEAVKYWGDLGLTKFSNAFNFATNLTEVPPTLEGAEAVTEMDFMFWGARSFNQDLSGWNVSGVTSFYAMFADAESFNGDVSNWDVSSTSSLLAMFAGATVFNQDISEWDVSNATNFGSMFSGAKAFNQDISSWDVSSVNNFGSMFSGATAFNQDISGWDTSSATQMSSMFEGASSFNQNIMGWNVEQVTSMARMFKNATSFNQRLQFWMVCKIAVEPFEFDLGATAWTEPSWRPLWGRRNC